MKKLFAVLLVVVCAVYAQDMKSGARTLSTGTGRYVLGQINDNAKEQFLFDTQSGRLWMLGMTDDSMKVLKEIPFADVNDGFTPTPNSIEEAKIKYAVFSKNRSHKQSIDLLVGLRKGAAAMTNKEFFTLCQKHGASIDEAIEAAKASIPKYGAFAEDAAK